jgi:crotonobetainyl-CoA:carnitine CoA-transferase CaiB-like acyl-CoA transferase
VPWRWERANVSGAPVGKPEDLFTDPHLLATGGLLDVCVSRLGGEEGTRVDLPALPIEFGTDRQRPGIERQPPHTGEHKAEILEEAGFTPAEIEALGGKRGIAAAV